MQWPIHCSHSSSIAHKFRYWLLLKTENSITIAIIYTERERGGERSVAATRSGNSIHYHWNFIETDKFILWHGWKKKRLALNVKGQAKWLLVSLLFSASSFSASLTAEFPLIRIQIHMHTSNDFETEIKSQNNRERTINWRKIRQENLFGVRPIK